MRVCFRDLQREMRCVTHRTSADHISQGQKVFEFPALLAYAWRELPSAGRPNFHCGLLGELMDKPFPIVGVGASAGGVEALHDLFKSMPPEPGMAFVIISPPAPKRERSLPEILASARAMAVPTREHDQASPPNRGCLGR